MDGQDALATVSVAIRAIFGARDTASVCRVLLDCAATTFGSDVARVRHLDEDGLLRLGMCAGMSDTLAALLDTPGWDTDPADPQPFVIPDTDVAARLGCTVA